LWFYWRLPLRLNPPYEWERSFGGSEEDVANSVEPTSDGGYIIAGFSMSNDGDVPGNHGSFDCWILKLQSDGSIEWRKSFGGSAQDEAHTIQQTRDGGYIVAGSSRSNDGDMSGNHGSDDFWVVKLKASGDVEWQKSLGGSGRDVAWAVQQTADEGYIVAGNSESSDGDVSVNHGEADFWVVKLKVNGDIEWQKSLGGSGLDYAHSVQQTSDGGYILAGATLSDDGDVPRKPKRGGGGDYAIVKLKANGDIEWQKSLGGSGTEFAYSVQQTSDGGYIIAGSTESNDGDVSGHSPGKVEKFLRGTFTMYSLDSWIVKLKADGTLEWERACGGSKKDNARAVRQTNDGGYIVVGSTSSNDGDVSGNHGNVDDVWIVKLKADGAIEWEKACGGRSRDNARAVQQTNDGGYIVAGSTSSNDGDVSERKRKGIDLWVVKLGSE
jgi:hypothetical protein